MLSVAPLSSGKAGYYLSLTAASYYTEAPEPEGLWYGIGAREFGLSGTVAAEDLVQLCEGFDPRDPSRHVRNAGVHDGPRERKPGDDLCFSAPKSISTLWALSSAEEQLAIQAKLHRAVKDALDYIQETCGFARTGAQGQQVVSAPLAFALFEHCSSRLADPQLHVHAVCPNLSLHEGGHGKLRVTAIDSTDFYRHQMAAGALFRASLADGMRELGYTVERDGFAFKIAGVGDSLCEKFSQRRAEIVEGILKAAKFVGNLSDLDAREVLHAARGRMAEIVTLDTRRNKKEYTRGELMETWRNIAREMRLDESHMAGLKHHPQGLTPEQKHAVKEEVFAKTVAKLADDFSHFGEKELTRTVAEEAQGLGLDARDVRELVQHKLASRQLVNLGELVTEKKHAAGRTYRERAEPRYTTEETLEREGLMLASAGRMAREDVPVNRDIVEGVIRSRPMLSGEQADAVRLLTAGPGRIACMTGKAGTGKSCTLDACREVLELGGRTVIGCALAGVAADELRRSAGIASDTIASTLYRLEDGRMRLGRDAVLVVDEAGMVPTKLMQRLIDRVEKAGAKIVLVGDAAQLQAIGAGGPFRSISERIGPGGHCQLTKIHRQKEEWRKKTVEQFSRGEAREALMAYTAKGQLHVVKTRDDAFKGLVARWEADNGLHNSKDVLLLTSLNVEVRAINQMCQEKRQKAGMLGERRLFVNGEFLYENDRVMLGKNSKPLGVKNGFSGDVVKIDEARKSITVKLDRDGREVTLSVDDYGAKNLALGYATSVHKSQGRTVERCHVLMGGNMDDLHLGYVQASRSRESTHLFIDKTNAGPGLKDAIRSLSRSRSKDLARDVIDRTYAQAQEPMRRPFDREPSRGPSLRL